VASAKPRNPPQSQAPPGFVPCGKPLFSAFAMPGRLRLFLHPDVKLLRILSPPSSWNTDCIRRDLSRYSIRKSTQICGVLLAAATGALLLSPTALTRQNPSAAPVVVQPGAPGQPSKTLPASARAALPRLAPADVAFMQGMIMHHQQAVEMTAWIPSHTENKELQALGARISRSQSDEIQFMRRWLVERGQPQSMPMSGMPDMDMPHHHAMMMPGMLTPQQMEALKKAKGAEFDRLFLVGMIQHHEGALTMVKELFDTAGAGEDAELFDFATDADNSQRAEIKIMQAMLEKMLSEEKR